MKNYWRKKTVFPDNTISYLNASKALEDLEFKYIGEREVYNPTEKRYDKYETRDCYEKDGKQYCYVGMRNMNTTIYEIYLRNI